MCSVGTCEPLIWVGKHPANGKTERARRSRFMDVEGIKKCEVCEAEDGVMRPVRQAQSEIFHWVCSDECEEHLRASLEFEYQECPACGGRGSFDCKNPFCSEGRHDCQRCEGAGLVDRDGLDERVVH